MGGWQIAWIVYTGLGLLVAAHLHGKETRYNFWITLIGLGITFVLLYFGGFFSCVRIVITLSES